MRYKTVVCTHSRIRIALKSIYDHNVSIFNDICFSYTLPIIGHRQNYSNRQPSRMNMLQIYDVAPCKKRVKKPPSLVFWSVFCSKCELESVLLHDKKKI